MIIAVIKVLFQIFVLGGWSLGLRAAFWIEPCVWRRCAAVAGRH